MRLKLIILLSLIPLFLVGQHEITKPERATYFMAYDSIRGTYHSGVTQPNQETVSGQPSFVAEADEIEFLKKTDNTSVEYIPLPDVGEEVTEGIYEYNNKLIICRQDHIRTTFI